MQDVQEIDQALEHPDPDPETLPVPPPGWHPASQQAAEHLCRAVLHGRESVETLRHKARQDATAWADLIRVAEARVQEQEDIIRDWMLKHEVQSLKTPWFTASIRKATSKVVINDETAAIEVCRAKGYISAIRVRESLDKKEFDTFFNADPQAFAPGIEGDVPISEDVLGEPSLVIRPKATKEEA